MPVGAGDSPEIELEAKSMVPRQIQEDKFQALEGPLLHFCWDEIPPEDLEILEPLENDLGWSPPNSAQRINCTESHVQSRAGSGREVEGVDP